MCIYIDADAWNCTGAGARRFTQERMPAMKLYYSPGACSLAPHIVLREAGFDFDLDRVAFPAKTTQNGQDFVAINQKGAVPTLWLDDGEVITEAAVILQYLADQAPAKGLLPPAGNEGALPRAGVAQLYRDRTAQGLRAAVEARHAEGLQGGGEREPRQAVRLSRRQARRPELSHRLDLHGGGRLPVHHSELGAVPPDRSQALSQRERLHGARRRASARAGRVAGRGPGEGGVAALSA